MQIHWNQATESYEFDTGEIFGSISPFGWYHGLSGLMHRSHQFNLVRPKNSFLNAEYYIQPDSNRKMLPRTISAERKTTHKLVDNSVVVHFPPEDEYNFALELCYSAHDDVVDMGMTIKPGMNVPGFEIFFASYVCEGFDETWAPLSSPNGSGTWTKLCNRDKLNSVFGVMRNASQLGLLPAEYPDIQVDIQERVFSEPILVARDSASGLALIFLCDPHLTKYLAGQYHGWDTAHDWSFAADLIAGKEISTRVRLICRCLPDLDQMYDQITQLWAQFKTEADQHA